MACKEMKCDQFNLQYIRREVDICVKFGRQAYIAECSADVAWNPSNSSVLLYMDYYPSGDLHGMIQRCGFHSTTILVSAQTMGQEPA